MSIEPSNAYTVHIRPVMPPKPATVIPQPRLSMAEEAKQVRARFRNAWGTFSAKGGGDEANIRRQQQALAEREDLAARALAMITERRRMKAEMLEALDTTENRLRQALQLLRDAGKVAVKREGAAAWWAAE